MLDEVQYRNANILINRDGKPVSAIIDLALFERVQRMRDRFDALTTQIACGYIDVPMEVGLGEIDALVAEERAR